MPWLQPWPVRSPMTKHERRVQWLLMKDTQMFSAFSKVQRFFVKKSAAVSVPVMKRRRMSSRSVIFAL